MTSRNVFRRLIPVIAILAIALVTLGVCSAPAGAAPRTGSGHGSVYQAYLVDAQPGAAVRLIGPGGDTVGSGTVDRLGSFLVRDLTPGAGYHFVVGGAAGNAFAVRDESAPARSLYTSQKLHAGLNYVRMRDGVELAVTVRLPYGKTLADGPFPTVIEYSGYQHAAPGDFLVGAVEGLAKINDPLAPATGTLLGNQVAPTAGFASVNVQMRGSGCSGGAFDLFDWPTIYDGYDIVETVGAQSWTKHHKVGLVGISFSGISQIAVAGTHPPSLAAIAPMSLTDDLYSTGFPGGIFNNGFANSWLTERQDDAEPAPGGGQPYARELVRRGDRHCKNNQKLRLQTQRIKQLIEDNPTRTPSLMAHRSPSYWADRVTVPVYLVGALQDEQTGPQWTEIIKHFDHNPNVWVRMMNGAHLDSIGPQFLGPWYEFLRLFVDGTVPKQNDALTALMPVVYAAVTSSPGRPLVTARHPEATNLAQAKALFKRDPRIQVFFDNGSGTPISGNLSSPWSRGFSSWPAASVGDGQRWTLGAGGTLTRTPGASSSVAFRPDPKARPQGTMNVEGASTEPWSASATYDWAPIPGRAGVGFITAPQPHDVLVAGPGSLDLQLSSSAPDTDLQATVSEVRPDGTEILVTTGFLRASLRATNASATALDPTRDWLNPTPLSGTQTARIQLASLGHVFRKGSRIRIAITAPGGDKTSWRFQTPNTGGRVVDTIGLGAGGSSLVLPVVPGQRAGGPAPDCQALRGEPCRRYRPAFNGG
ncbi:MAG: CocE/NonD family hydrolase [Gordonia sp. (in: high G+C Gram-positive bacteria)]|uniref:CocE/NonD family hydrolase n=1 Tax=Gordonia sp. (in: high G+C Gram-positive bacteria) TaxID=84139 RepID=UPI0039E48EDD